MSLKNGVFAYRMPLLYGASLTIAGFVGSACLTLAPAPAQAQSMCTPTPQTGAGTNSVTYTGNQAAGIDCSTTGAFTLTKSSGTVSDAGFALDITSTGAVTVNNTAGVVGGVSFNMPNGTGAVNFSGVTGGGVTFTHAGATNTSGRWLASGASVFSAGNDTLNFSGVGYNIMAEGSSIDFGAGNDTLNVAGFLETGAFAEVGALLDFGTGTDTVNMSGLLVTTGVTTFANLEAFNNSGTIYLGAMPTRAGTPTVDWTQVDGAPDDKLRMASGTFAGAGNSRVVVDINIGADQQAGCETLTGAADCLDLRGASTAGTTLVTLNNHTTDSTLSVYNPIGVTVVDVGGAGTSASGHFVLDPSTAGYIVDPTYGGAITRPGLFVYSLRYDAVNQRHNLVGLPRSETMEYAMLPGAAQSVWNLTAETVTDRQTDLRAGAEGGSVWLRTAGEYAKRDVAANFSIYGDGFTFDNSYKLYIGTIIGGIDFLKGDTGTFEYVLGGQIGYVSSSLDLTASPSSGRFTGATGGLYGSLWNSAAFLDAALNLNGLTLDYDSPGLGSKTNTFLNSVGLRLDAGTRWPLTEAIYIEPLASFAYARTGFEEISLFGGEIKPEDSKTVRGALGLRVGGDYEGSVVNASYYVTGRAWNEFEGKSAGSVVNPGVPLPFADDASGAFGEAEAGVSLFNDANTLSGFASTGVKWKDGYSAVDLSLGVRMAW